MLKNKYIALFFSVLILTGCSTVKHVPDGSYLLDDVKIVIERDGECAEEITPASLNGYLRQTPNSKMLGLFKLQLATYSLAGRDSTKAFNRWLKKLGQAPVIYSGELTERSTKQLQLALNNKGYNDAYITVDSFPHPEKKKIEIRYNVMPGCPQHIRNLTFHIPDTALATEILGHPGSFPLRQGMVFDRNELENARVGITENLRRKGYYAFLKDYITFTADTAAGSKDVDLTMVVKPPYQSDGRQGHPDDRHIRYRFDKVYFITDGQRQLLTGDTLNFVGDTVNYRGLTVLYGKDRYLRPSILYEKCFILPGQPFNTVPIDQTYQALSQLSILNYINIVMRPVGEKDGIGLLDAYVFLDRGKKQSVAFEVEGTNSEGDLGFGVALTYQHRDLARRGEVFSTKFSASYESLSGNFEGLINNRYTELGAEVGLSFPRFVFPFLSREYKRKVRATSEVTVNFNFQQRPEYTRIIAGAGWKYRWTLRNNTERRTYDLVDISVVSLPKSTIDFLNTVAPLNPLLRYSYEDHFIMRMAYSYFRTNRRNMLSPGVTGRRNSLLQRDIYTLRTSVETAGNVLYALSSLCGQKKDDGVYKIFGIQYAQYVKGEIDYSRLFILNTRNSIALRGYLGLATPYGNSSMIPFEKRFYAGGANGVRGWSVRTLGPGRYPATNSVSDFINQCGDINLILSAEYRFKMFWVFEGALFVDAGNIWTVRNYENQPGGLFQFNDFYKEVAASYGVGLRLDFTYFLVRLDLGMKARNPAINQEPWPIAHPHFGRDAAFHFSVGYPF